MSQEEREVLEKIAQVMESLPSESLLAKCWTEEQKEEWHKRRKWNILIAQAWREERNLIKGDGLDIALKKKEIDKLEKYGIELFVDYYYTLWEIVKVVEPYVDFFHSFLRYIVSTADFLSVPLPQIFLEFFRKILIQQYSFDSPYELFSEILKENEDDIFSVCLRKSYQEVSLKKAEIGSQLISKFLFKGMKDGFYYQPQSFNEIEEIKKQIKKHFPWIYFSTSWQDMVITVSQFAVEDKLLTQKALDDFNELAMETCRLNGTASRKRKSKTWDKRRSVAWKNGKKAYAEDGVYKFP